MDKGKNKHFDKYLSLRNKIESHSAKLAKEHSKQMLCKKGCSMCCMDYSIFPIEFYFIVNDFKEKEIEFKSLSESNEDVCAFLENQVCSMYEQRPIICRTHGLPLLFMNDNSEWELSACELNFTEFDFGEFTLDNTFPQDKFNSKLFMLNKEFIAGFQDKKYGEMDLIPIKELLDHL
jgi:Fe-S-cluster containining protein